MVRIDARYVIPALRETAWSCMADPFREPAHGWALHGGADLLLSGARGVAA